MVNVCYITILVIMSSLTKAQKSIDIESPHAVEIAAPMPLDMAPPLNTVQEGVVELPSAVFDIPQPSLSLVQPTVELPKDAPEVHDVPHANIGFSGNVLKEKTVVLNIPSPVIEVPKPIVQTKPALFRVPQSIFVIPSPVIQHKPMVYKIPHTLIVHRPEVNLQQYHVAIPQMKVVKGSKSAYTQPIPESYKVKESGPVFTKLDKKIGVVKAVSGVISEMEASKAASFEKAKDIVGRKFHNKVARVSKTLHGVV